MPKQAAPALRFLKGGLHGRVLGCLPAQFSTVKGFERTPEFSEPTSLLSVRLLFPLYVHQ